MEHDEECDLNLHMSDIYSLSDIRETPDILQKIKWDATPQRVMEPRFLSKPEDMQRLKELSGYMFYIESQCEPPALMLLKIGKTDITSTVGKIDEIPLELVRKALENPEDKPVNGMYAITGEIREWLKKELGV
jgi:hypothetical protein